MILSSAVRNRINSCKCIDCGNVVIFTEEKEVDTENFICANCESAYEQYGAEINQQLEEFLQKEEPDLYE